MAEEAAVDAMEELEQPEPGEKEHRRELHLFNQIATITAHTLDLQEIINEVLDTVLKFFRIDAGFLLLWDPVRQRLTYAASRAFPRSTWAGSPAGPWKALCGPTGPMPSNP